MKRLILTIALLGIGFQMVKGQSFYMRKNNTSEKAFISAAATTFKSARGLKFGFDLSYNSKKDFHIGVFSYKGVGSLESGKDTFQGIQIGFALARIKKWTVGSDQRIGVYNKRFLSFLPTLKLSYKASDIVTASMGAGISDRLLVVDFKLIFKL